MMNRRLFVKLSGTIGAASILGPNAFCFSTEKKGLYSKIKLVTEFSNGGGEVLLNKIDPITIQVVPHNQNNGGWSKIWWHFQVEGVAPNENIVLNVEKGSGYVEQVFYSYDDENWALTNSGEIIELEGKEYIQIHHVVRGDKISFAYDLPYRMKELESLLLPQLQGMPRVRVFDYCKSKHGRLVKAIQLKCTGKRSERKYGVWLQARAHSFEAGSSWVLHELTQWLISNHPLAMELRKTTEITILPIVDVDAVEEGRTGKNQKPYDHNRGWSEEVSHWPEVNTTKSKLKKMSTENMLDLFIDFHGPGNKSHPYFIIAVDKNLKTDIQRDNRQKFFEVLGAKPFDDSSKNTQSMHQFFYSKREWKSKNHDSSNMWVGHNTTNNVINLTLEVNMGTPLSTIDGYKVEAITLGKAIAKYFNQGNHQK
ncbi:M14 family zinc carboxypeptidase [Membranihabitans marinus]|uniref:M14 family zinc carboxypeptidase n=1 Tax=Membranihabitans marinus TaxID=1227546 RepID=UPI001F2104DE|nr:M14 family zinc carboxypeptidase [Membranihabitans marinus]